MNVAAAPTELVSLFIRLLAGLFEEADDLPGQVLAYGRPHEHPRVRTFPKFTRTGEPLPGRTRIGPDCPQPVRGRCECRTDGSWRPSPGDQEADHVARHARRAEDHEDRGERDDGWRSSTYVRRPDGLWVCVRPYRRALDRLRAYNLRHFLVLARLLDQWPAIDLVAAWESLGDPADRERETERTIAGVLRLVDEEMAAEYERNPERPRARRKVIPFTELSESQRNAEADLTPRRDAS